MKANRNELINAVGESVQDLQCCIDRHRRLVAAALEQRADKPGVGHFSQILEVQCSRQREKKLKAAIRDAIEDLEQSRKSFKSKQLESLRKKLIQVLADMDSSSAASFQNDLNIFPGKD